MNATDTTTTKLPPSFGRLNTAQFLGAMNDNILKLLIIFCLIGAQGAEKAGVITASVGAAFVLPFLIFSAPAGCLADRLAKSRVIVAVKLAEVIVTALAVAAFAFGWHSGLYLVVFLMATHSAFFRPRQVRRDPRTRFARAAFPRERADRILHLSGHHLRHHPGIGADPGGRWPLLAGRAVLPAGRHRRSLVRIRHAGHHPGG